MTPLTEGTKFKIGDTVKLHCGIVMRTYLSLLWLIQTKQWRWLPNQGKIMGWRWDMDAYELEDGTLAIEEMLSKLG